MSIGNRTHAKGIFDFSIVEKLNLDNEESDERFERIARMVQRSTGAEMVYVSFFTSQKEFLKARVGFNKKSFERESSIGLALVADCQSLAIENQIQDYFDKDSEKNEWLSSINQVACQSICAPNGKVIGTITAVFTSGESLQKKGRHCLEDAMRVVEHELSNQWLDCNPTKKSETENKTKDWFLQQDSRLKKLLFTASERKVSMGLSFMCAVVLMLGVVNWYQETNESIKAESREQENSVASALRAKIETELNSRLHLTYGLAGLVRANHKVDEDSFQRFANDIGNGLSSVSSLQLAPSGVVQHVWPYEKHHKAIGHDLLADPARRIAAQKAIDARKVWLAGPLNLIQGGVAIIGRYPIFTSTMTGEESFWGFATILIDFNQFIDVVKIAEVTDNYQISIRGKDATGNHGDVFWGDPEVYSGDYTSAEITLPAGSWEIGVKAKSIATPPAVPMIFSSIFVVALSWLFFFLFRLPKKFERSVKSASKALEESEIRFRDAIEALPDGFVIFDRDDKLLACNKRFNDFYDRSSEVIEKGKTFEDIIRHGYRNGQYIDGQKDNEDVFVAERLKQHHEASHNSEEQLSNGRWIREVERPIRGGGIVGLRVDITELKRKEAELAVARDKAEAANKAKSTFLATMSHEVRTPMNVVLGLLSHLLDSESLPYNEKHYIRTAYQSANQLLHILNEILDLSKVESGKLSLERVDFNIWDILDDIQQFAKNQLQHKPVDFRLQIKPLNQIWYKGDESRIRQVLINLINNAGKFTDEGMVSLELEQEVIDLRHSLLRFKVFDTGVGFDETDKEMMFRPFSQVDSSASRQHEGVGLGLTICQRLVALMGGTISAKGVKGKGAEFVVEIPMEASLTKYQIPHQSKNNPSSVEQESELSILIAEDSPSNQIVFEAMLSNLPYKIDMVSNGKEVLERLEDNHYDLILMDIYMPEMNGVDATINVRQNKNMNDIPIIALTANAMKGDRERFIEAGMDDYLPKPVNKEKLLKKIQQWGKKKTTNIRSFAVG